jgi:hypothetical protein
MLVDVDGCWWMLLDGGGWRTGGEGKGEGKEGEREVEIPDFIVLLSILFVLLDWLFWYLNNINLLLL